MKVVITKDEHLQLGFRNKFRKPGWEDDMIKKHQFIIKYMIENNIKHKITTGDIFDKQTGWSFKQFLLNKKNLSQYQEAGIEVISIAGNHDMLEGRLNIKDSPFEEMIKNNLIKYIGDYGNSYLIQENDKIIAEVRGIDYRNFNDLYTKKDFLEEIKNLDYKIDNLRILVIHQNVTPVKNRVTELMYDEVANACDENNIKVLICGHYHIGYPTTKINNTIIINPWNLWRTVRDYEVQMDNHTPEIVILDLETLEWEHIIIPYKKFQEAFNLIEIDTYKKIKKEFSFIENVNLDNIDEIDDKNLIPLIIKKLKEKGLNDNLIEKILQEVNSKIDL